MLRHGILLVADEVITGPRSATARSAASFVPTMLATSLQSFYATAASVAGALIGLLFVAVTVARDRPGENPRSRHQIPAAAALTAFTNTLCISLFGLIEHGQVAIPAAVSGIAGILFVFASLISLVRPATAAATTY